MGTMFIAAVYGPFYGMLPSLLSGLILGITVDMYSLYYAPVGIFPVSYTHLAWHYYKDMYPSYTIDVYVNKQQEKDVYKRQLLACVFIKLVSPSNFDITYLLLVISFFITKKKIKPQFEAVI